MLHSRKLLYINEIARSGSIRKAAARLNVASSAINRQILALEEEMGAPLFERLPRGLRLTAAGELCIEHIRDVLKNYERLEGRIRSLKMQQAGKVRLVTTVGLAAGPLPEIIARFQSEHPRVFMQLRNDAGTMTVNPVLSGEVDIGLGFNIPARPHPHPRQFRHSYRRCSAARSPPDRLRADQPGGYRPGAACAGTARDEPA